MRKSGTWFCTRKFLKSIFLRILNGICPSDEDTTGWGILNLLQIPLRKYFFPKFSFFENCKSFVKKSCFENFKNNFRPIFSVKCKAVKKRVWYPFTEENEKKSVFLKICTYIKTKIDLRFHLMRISPVITTVAVVTSSLNSSKPRAYSSDLG